MSSNVFHVQFAELAANGLVSRFSCSPHVTPERSIRPSFEIEIVGEIRQVQYCMPLKNTSAGEKLVDALFPLRPRLWQVALLGSRFKYSYIYYMYPRTTIRVLMGQGTPIILGGAPRHGCFMHEAGMRHHDEKGLFRKLSPRPLHLLFCSNVQFLCAFGAEAAWIVTRVVSSDYQRNLCRPRGLTKPAEACRAPDRFISPNYKSNESKVPMFNVQSDSHHHDLLSPATKTIDKYA